MPSQAQFVATSSAPSKIITISAAELEDALQRTNSYLPESFIWSLLKQGTTTLAELHYGVDKHHTYHSPFNYKHQCTLHGDLQGSTFLIHLDTALLKVGSQESISVSFKDTGKKKVNRRFSLNAPSNPYNQRTFKTEMSCLIQIVHRLAHRADYISTRTELTSSEFCYCFAEGSVDWQYSRELVGVLAAAVDSQDKSQLSSIHLHHHLSPTFMKQKLRPGLFLDDYVLSAIEQIVCERTAQAINETPETEETMDGANDMAAPPSTPGQNKAPPSSSKGGKSTPHNSRKPKMNPMLEGAPRLTKRIAGIPNCIVPEDYKQDLHEIVDREVQAYQARHKLPERSSVRKSLKDGIPLTPEGTPNAGSARKSTPAGIGTIKSEATDSMMDLDSPSIGAAQSRRKGTQLRKSTSKTGLQS